MTSSVDGSGYVEATHPSRVLIYELRSARTSRANWYAVRCAAPRTSATEETASRRLAVLELLAQRIANGLVIDERRGRHSVKDHDDLSEDVTAVGDPAISLKVPRITSS